MTQVITPAPGRIVWYHPAPNNNIPQLYEQPLAAIVACVWDDRRVNLSVIDAYGHHHAVKDVMLVQPDTTAPDAGVAYAEWMPFQKGQAAKTEMATAIADAAISAASVAVAVAQDIAENTQSPEVEHPASAAIFAETDGTSASETGLVTDVTQSPPVAYAANEGQQASEPAQA